MLFGGVRALELSADARALSRQKTNRLIFSLLNAQTLAAKSGKTLPLTEALLYPSLVRTLFLGPFNRYFVFVFVEYSQFYIPKSERVVEKKKISPIIWGNFSKVLK